MPFRAVWSKLFVLRNLTQKTLRRETAAWKVDEPVAFVAGHFRHSSNIQFVIAWIPTGQEGKALCNSAFIFGDEEISYSL